MADLFRENSKLCCRLPRRDEQLELSPFLFHVVDLVDCVLDKLVYPGRSAPGSARGAWLTIEVQLTRLSDYEAYELLQKASYTGLLIMNFAFAVSPGKYNLLPGSRVGTETKTVQK